MGSCKKGVNVVNVAAKTINLAKEPLKKLPPCGGRPEPTMGCPPPIPPPPASHIRVCTPEQLRSICPPEPCVCPDLPRPPTGGERFLSAVIIISKCLFLLGFIKWTDDLGVWGNTESTKNLLQDAAKRLSPVLKPKSSDSNGSGSSSTASENYYGFTYNIASMWNDTVGKVFYVIGVLPVSACSKVFGVVNNKKKEEAPSEESSPPPEDAKDMEKSKTKYKGTLRTKV